MTSIWLKAYKCDVNGLAQHFRRNHNQIFISQRFYKMKIFRYFTENFLVHAALTMWLPVSYMQQKNERKDTESEIVQEHYSNRDS